MASNVSKRLCAMALAATALLVILSACRASDPAPAPSTISFTRLYEELLPYDRVRITLTSPDGAILDQAFYGKVARPSDLENLVVPHWDGGPVTVEIVGYNGESISYRTETDFNGKTNQKGEPRIYVAPGMTLTARTLDIPLLAGDSIPFPGVTVSPATLQDKTLYWTATGPTVLRLEGGYLKALAQGTAQVTARLNAAPAMSLEFTVMVVRPDALPERLTLTEDTLRLITRGPGAKPTARIQPDTANKAIRWRLADSLVARVDEDGTAHGLRAGVTLLWAASALKPAVYDSVVLAVADSAPVVPVHQDVAQVRFLKENTVLFLGGASELLTVEVLPANSEQAVSFTTPDTARIILKDGRISAKALGQATVIAASVENPLLSDTLRVTVSPTQFVDSVHINADAFLLYSGGDPKTLAAQVHPTTASQKIQWRSAQPGVAKVDDSGKVSGVAAGKTLVYALSGADSLKRDSVEVTVKTDAPVLSVGKDTTVFVGVSVRFLPTVAPQEHGTVVQFKWDVDGIPGWDDSIPSVGPVVYRYATVRTDSARFYVRDSEGNESTAAKKVTVVLDTASMNARNDSLLVLKIGGVALNLAEGATEFIVPNVPFLKSSVEIEAATMVPTAKIRIGNGTDDVLHTVKKTVDLALGENEISVLVTAGNGFSTRNYWIRIARDPSDRLAMILPTLGALKPAFSPVIKSYTMNFPPNSVETLQWRVTAEDSTKTIRQVMRGYAQAEIHSGGYSLDYLPDIGGQTVAFGFGGFGSSMDSLYRIGVCAQGFKFFKNQELDFSTFQTGVAFISSDATDAYVSMVDRSAGDKATVWKISDTTISMVGGAGYTPAINAVAVAMHSGKLITAYASVPMSGLDSSRVTLLSREGSGWSAHSNLPRFAFFNSRVGLISFNNRFFASILVRPDTAAFFEYKANAWSQIGTTVPSSTVTPQFFAVGSNLYSVVRESAGLCVRKLETAGFAKIGDVVPGADFREKFSVSEDATGRPVLAADWSSYPAQTAKVYRLQSGVWSLMQEFTTPGSMESVSLIRSGGKLLFFYENNGNPKIMSLDEATGKWVFYSASQIGPSQNTNNARLVQTASGLFLISVQTSGFYVNKFIDCAGY